MTKILLLFFMDYLLLSKISDAKYTNREWPNAPPIAKAPTAKAPTAKAPTAKATSAKAPTPALVAPTPVPTNAPTFDRITPKCYPETATAYFLPAPPSSPKITVLNSNPPTLNQNVREKPVNIFKEVPATLSFPPPSQMSSRVAFPPPPPCLIGLPDLMDEISFKTQERISRLAESKEKPPVCESCATLIKKLPIFNFDQELLNGFLASIGI